MKLREITVREVADLLRVCGPGSEQACLLIGAGVSLTAGIGLASDFVTKIKGRYPALYEKACREAQDGNEPGYAECMAALPPARQVELIREDIDQAKINWAHIGIARLEKSQKISSILTTNFDPLASRACAIFHRFPAIYDLAGLRDEQNSRISFDGSYVKGSAIFHLHGQHTGFLLLNTDEKLNAQADRIKPVLDAVMKGKPVIIAGYSGENDPLIDRIAELAPFNHGLFWVCRNDKDPASSVCQKLLSLENCYVIRNKPSDIFFTELANALDLNPPAFLANPFEHMTEILSTLRPYSDLGDFGDPDLLESAKQQLSKANNAKSDEDRLVDQLAELMAKGDYAETLALYPGNESQLSGRARDLFAWAAIMEGNVLSDRAKAVHGEEADALFDQASEKYSAALAIKPNSHEALSNWGVALSDQAKTKQGQEADALFIKAGEKYAAALAIKPDKHEALNNWGNAISDHAKTKQGEEADALFAQATEKYAAALAIKPDKHEALNNWGAALSDQAKTKHGDEADRLFAAASEKYAAALASKPDKHEALNNWGAALSEQARKKQGDEADSLFAQAGEKYAAALAIKPNMHEALSNWGGALLEQARTKQGEVAYTLFFQSGEKYAAALAINPDMPEALNNWGASLLEQAKTKQGEEADELFVQAGEKFAHALAMDPDMTEALNNWGVALSDRAKTKHGEEADELFVQAGEKYAAALAIKPDKPHALINWGNALSEQAKTKQGQDADALFALAGEKHAAALAIEPDMPEALINWGAALSEQAKTKQGEEAIALLAKARDNLTRADRVSPGSCFYNLACLSALMGDEVEASRLLVASYEAGADWPGCEHLRVDSDFDAIRGSDALGVALKRCGCAC